MDKLRPIAIGILTLLTISGCKPKTGKSEMPPLNIDYAICTTRPLSEQIWFATSTTPLKSVTIEPRVNGYLKSINYTSGTPIKRGMTIFTIDPSQISTEYYAAQAALESARASLIEAHNNYQRAIPLVRVNAISRSAYDQYKAQYAAAESDVKSAKQTLRNAELNLSYTTLKSPIDGLIAQTSAENGDYVGPGTQFATLTTITDIDTVLVDLAIPTSRYIKYVENKNSFDNSELLSDITLILADSTIYPHKGIYDYTQQSVSSANSSVVIVAKFPNPKGTLKSNMFARVKANIGQPIERLMVPQRAVSQMQGISSVWVISPDSTVSYRSVEVGDTYGNMWQIKSGVTRGEMVATSGQLKLHQGAKVTPTKR